MDYDDEEQEEGGVLVVERTRGERLCEGLLREAKRLVEGLDVLETGADELGLEGEHRLFELIEDARSALEQIAWHLDSESLRDQIDVPEDEDDEGEGDD